MGRTGVVGWLRKRTSPLIFWDAGSHEELREMVWPSTGANLTSVKRASQ
jgi:hypothetical protein